VSDYSIELAAERISDARTRKYFSEVMVSYGSVAKEILDEIESARRPMTNPRNGNGSWLRRSRSGHNFLRAETSSIWSGCRNKAPLASSGFKVHSII
jgi:hypothetical protein